jgi:hypothetical protein
MSGEKVVDGVREALQVCVDSENELRAERDRLLRAVTGLQRQLLSGPPLPPRPGTRGRNGGKTFRKGWHSGAVAEREACAKLAEKTPIGNAARCTEDGWNAAEFMRIDVAAAIRARGGG